MNIAILWFGEYRNSDIAMKFNNFDKLRKNHNVTDFISTWENRISEKSPEYDIVNDYYKNECVTELHYNKFLDISNCKIHKKNELNFIDDIEIKDCTVNSMSFHLKYLINEIKNKNFDLVFLLRTDVVYNIDFDFIENFNFDDKIVVQTCIYKKEKLEFLHDLFFISNFKTIEKFIDNILFDIEGGSHYGWSKIINDLKIKCISVSDIVNKNYSSFIVRYFMRKSINLLDKITDEVADKQREVSEMVYPQFQKLI